MTQSVHIVRPDEGRLGALRILAGEQATRGLYFAFEMETPPSDSDAALDVHTHARYEESEYVLTGEREIVVDDHRWRAGPGFFALAPRDARHGMRTIGTTPSRWLHFFSPADVERYFVERERMREAGASAEELRALSARYNVSGHASPGALPEPVHVSAIEPLVVSGGETRNAYALAEQTKVREDEHEHPDQEEAFYVLSGELTVEVGGAPLTASEGCFVLIPRGVRHHHAATPGTKVLTVLSPGGA